MEERTTNSWYLHSFQNLESNQNLQPDQPGVCETGSFFYVFLSNLYIYNTDMQFAGHLQVSMII